LGNRPEEGHGKIGFVLKKKVGFKRDGKMGKRWDRRKVGKGGSKKRKRPGGIKRRKNLSSGGGKGGGRKDEKGELVQNPGGETASNHEVKGTKKRGGQTEKKGGEYKTKKMGGKPEMGQNSQ